MKPMHESEPVELTPAMQATLQAREALLRGHETQFATFRRHDARHRLREFAVFVTCWLLGMTLALTGWHSTTWTHWPLTVCGILLSALAINAFVLLMHEGMHNVLFVNPRWNRAVSVALGATFMMSFTAYQILHIRHHNYLGDAHDPDDYRNYTRNSRLLWALHFVRLTVGCPIYIMMIPVLACWYGTARERRRIVTELLLLALVWMLVIARFPLTSLLVVWWIPLLVVALLVPIRGFTQHGITEAADPYIASRTITPHPLIAFLLLNENYHLEHHLFPEVPSYHLAALHQLVWPRLPYVVTGNSYLGFIARFLRAAWRQDETPIGLQQRLGAR